MTKTICILFAGLLPLTIGTTALAADIDAGETKFRQLCASCHGNSGKGDGPAAAALRPKPADMTTSQWQTSVDDEYLVTIITRGGPAVGKSPMMTPWGHALRGADLDNVIAYIRSLDD